MAQEKKMTSADLAIQDLRHCNKLLRSQLNHVYKVMFEYQRRLLAYEGIEVEGENNGNRYQRIFK